MTGRQTLSGAQGARDEHVPAPNEPNFEMRRIDDDFSSRNDIADETESLDLIVEEGRPLNSHVSQSLELQWLPLGPLRPTLVRITRWIEGPLHPRPYKIRPLFKSFQTSPSSAFARRGPHFRYWFLALLYILGLLFFVLVLGRFIYGCQVYEQGRPTRLSCNSTFWPDSQSCGVGGERCRPFHEERFAFRCPANCGWTNVWNPRTIGKTEINYQSLVVGGPKGIDGSRAVYRGDSFICGAALHAGLISNLRGGVGVVSLIGEQNGFPSSLSDGIQSIAFEQSFPQAFTFEERSATQPADDGSCDDPRWTILALFVALTSVVSVFYASPFTFFWTNFVAIFFCVALGTNPPDHTEFNAAVSAAFGRFLPAAFVGIVVYRYCVRQTLDRLTAHVEKTVLWLGACWVGALNNLTFDRLPLQRLTPHDIRDQPGAMPVLVSIVSAILAAALGQAWAFRVEGRLPRYLAFYSVLASALLILAAVPNLKLRLHHYLLALMLLPGTALQTRPSLIYQGLLVGLFINGLARWGFASILETRASLIAEGSKRGMVPDVAAPLIQGGTVDFDWSNLTDATGKLHGAFGTVSILINDGTSGFQHPYSFLSEFE